jgi:hypothetical protein
MTFKNAARTFALFLVLFALVQGFAVTMHAAARFKPVDCAAPESACTSARECEALYSGPCAR